jgi:hypothetical protein
MGTMVYFLGVKEQEREAKHTTPASAEVTNAWSYNSTPQLRFFRLLHLLYKGYFLPFLAALIIFSIKPPIKVVIRTSV